MKKTMFALLAVCAFISISCVVIEAPRRGPAPLDPDQVLMQQMSGISEGMTKSDALARITRKPSMVDEDQYYYYFQRERKVSGYPDYKQTGYLIEFKDDKVDNVEKLWRNVN